jgi:catechol 1,2-dioxygenase
MAEPVALKKVAAADDGGAFMESIIRQVTDALNEDGTADMNSRLLQVMPTVIRRIHELCREINLTEQEMLAVCEFLTKVGKHEEMVLMFDVFGVSVHANHNTFGENFEGNRASIEGPYYMEGAEIKADGKIAADDEPGVHLDITGRVTDARTGKPVPNAVIDFWQTNDAAEYDLDGFHLRGKVRADAEGRYYAHTVKPAGYGIGTAENPMSDLIGLLGRGRVRPGHLHLKVFADGYRDLTTQIFFKGDPKLHNDAVFSVVDNLVVDPKMDASGGRGSFEFDVALVPTGA